MGIHFFIVTITGGGGGGRGVVAKVLEGDIVVSVFELHFQQILVGKVWALLFSCELWVKSEVPIRFWAMPHFGISKILTPPVIFNSYLFKLWLQSAWRKLKRPINLVSIQAPPKYHMPSPNITMSHR